MRAITRIVIYLRKEGILGSTNFCIEFLEEDYFKVPQFFIVYQYGGMHGGKGLLSEADKIRMAEKAIGSIPIYARDPRCDHFSTETGN